MNTVIAAPVGVASRSRISTCLYSLASNVQSVGWLSPEASVTLMTRPTTSRLIVSAVMSSCDGSWLAVRIASLGDLPDDVSGAGEHAATAHSNAIANRLNLNIG